jgi:hypothetical protein
MHVQKRPAVTACSVRDKPLSHVFADTLGQLIYEKSANQFQRELDEEIEHGFWKDGAA